MRISGACFRSVLSPPGYKATKWGIPSHVRLRLRKRTSEPITAAHNNLFVGNVSFAIRKRTFALAGVNDREGSNSVVHGLFGRRRECPLLAISRHSEGSSRTSALPPKADIQNAKSRQ